MTRIVCPCALVLIVACAAAVAQPPADRLKEREQFQAQAEKLRAADKLAEAVAAAEKMLAIEREVLGRDHPDTVGSLDFLADLQEDRDDLAAARPYRQE